MRTLRFVGLDVLKEPIVIVVANEGQEAAVVMETITYDVPQLLKQRLNLVDDKSLLCVCYEEGPTG